MNTYLDNIKAKLTINDNIIKGYAVVFDSVDLVGDKFTKDTYFGELESLRPIVMYEHGFDKTLKKLPIGIVTKFEKDEFGIKFEAELKALNPSLWKELQIENSNEYLEEIKDLIKSKKLGVSSGAVGHAVVYEGNTLKQWPFGEISVTTRPAEPKTFIETKAGRVLSQKNLDRLSTAINELQSIMTEMEKAPETAKDMIEQKPKETTKQIDIDLKELVLDIKNLFNK
jgi:hypothetical protein